MGKRYLKNRLRRFLSLTGQALLELAIFGALIIMLLGVLINYGLRYNYQQQTMQRAFRKALSSAAESTEESKPISTTHMVVRDVHIPDPANPWGVGTVMPVISSAGVTRSYKLEATPDKESELPVIAIDVGGMNKCPGSYLSPKDSSPPCYYLTAGFREESGVLDNALVKYQQIYGSDILSCAGWDGHQCPEGGWRNVSNWYDIGDVTAMNISGTCTEWGDRRNHITGKIEKNVCIKYSIARIRFIDPCGGEIINYAVAVNQCRSVVDPQVCISECEKGKGEESTIDCDEICNKEMSPPNQNDPRYDPENKNIGGAWYCANYTEIDTGKHKYNFPILNKLFGLTSGESLGLQLDYTKTTTMRNILRKTEDQGKIRTEDTLNWEDITSRMIVYRPYRPDMPPSYGDTTGETSNEEIASSVSQLDTTIRETGWSE